MKNRNPKIFCREADIKMNRFLHTLCFILYACIASSQIAPGKYWIQFSDKTHNPYSVDRPEEFLSGRAVMRRINQNIPFTEQDLPVTPQYVDSLESLGLTILNVSKWFNGVVVASNDDVLLDTIHRYGFISGSPLSQSKSGQIAYKREDKQKFENKYDTLSVYGHAANQIEMLNGRALHSSGYLGEGKMIAITDAGFFNADELPLLENLWNNKLILVHRDFVDKDKTPYSSHSHGMMVLGACGGYIEDVFIGTAPKASYLLLRTEDTNSEYLIEEYNWLSAAEFADSMGADIISVSLGYSTFTEPLQDHTYADMDGETTPISRAANIASGKGMLVVTSAGNEGDESWYYITAPGDATSVLAVGAVDSTGIITDFSSRGPSSDGRVKPNVCAKGRHVYVQWIDGTFVLSNGTSYSCPLISGMAACLWQANPMATNTEIKAAIEQSADRYHYPDSDYGYGIPDFSLADDLLKEWIAADSMQYSVSVFPNPATSHVFIRMDENAYAQTDEIHVNIRKINGYLVQTINLKASNGLFFLNLNQIEGLNQGMYLLEIISENNTFTKKIMLF